MPGTMWLFLEGQIVQILGFVGHTVSVMTIHLCCQVMKMVIDNMETYNFDCVSIRLYLKKKKKQMAGQMWLAEQFVDSCPK